MWPGPLAFDDLALPHVALGQDTPQVPYETNTSLVASLTASVGIVDFPCRPVRSRRFQGLLHRIRSCYDHGIE